MKTFAALIFSLLALVPVTVQASGDSVLGGALIGGVAGAIIGNNSGGHNAWRGAAIGSVAGAMIGAAADDSHGRGYGGSRTYVSVGVGYGHPGYGYRPAPHYGWGNRGYYGGPVFYYSDYGYPSYATSGLFWGGLTGALIGDGRHGAWRGAAWGAGAGFLIGAIADANARESEERVVVVPQTQTAVSNQASQNAPQNVTIINNYYGNSSQMSSANGMFGR